MDLGSGTDQGERMATNRDRVPRPLPLGTINRHMNILIYHKSDSARALLVHLATLVAGQASARMLKWNSVEGAAHGAYKAQLGRERDG